jgi:hypothetical protein
MAKKPTQIFSGAFKEAYTNAGKLSLYELLDKPQIARICAQIAQELTVADLALSKELTAAAGYFVQIYASKNELTGLRAHKDQSLFEQASLRNNLRQIAAEERSKLPEAARKRTAQFFWSPAEDLSGLANPSQENPKGADRTGSRPSPQAPSLADRLAKAEAQKDRAARSAESKRKADAIVPPDGPLVSGINRGAVINPTLARAAPALHRRYIEIRARLAAAAREQIAPGDRRKKRARTNSGNSLESASTESQEQPISLDDFTSASTEFQALVRNAFGKKASWQAQYVSPEALRVLRTAIANGEKLAGLVQLGHGVRRNTVGRATAMRRLLTQGGDETMEDMARYLSHHDPTCIITKAENDADVQLRDEEMHALPSGGGLFRRSDGYGGCRLGRDEQAWVRAQIPK